MGCLVLPGIGIHMQYQSIGDVLRGLAVCKAIIVPLEIKEVVTATSREGVHEKFKCVSTDRNVFCARRCSML